MAIQSRSIPTTLTDQSIFTCPGNIATDRQEYAVTCMMFCNTSTQAVNLSVYYVNHAEYISAGNTIPTNSIVIVDLQIPAFESFSFDRERVILESGDFVYAKASATGLVVTISTMRVS